VLGSGADYARELRLELQDEFLLAIEDGEVRAAVPDIISVLALETGIPLSTERLQYGERVTVVGLPVPPGWTTEAGLRVAGPAAFGYDVPYTPLVGAA
jgi:hypothetical protein